MDFFKRTVLPVIAAVVAAFVVSSIWYSPMLFGRQWIALRSEALHVNPDAHIAAWKPWVELVREMVVAYVLLRFVGQLITADMTSIFVSQSPPWIKHVHTPSDIHAASRLSH